MRFLLGVILLFSKSARSFLFLLSFSFTRSIFHQSIHQQIFKHHTFLLLVTSRNYEENNTQKDLFTPKNGLEVLPKMPEEPVGEPLTSKKLAITTDFTKQWNDLPVPYQLDKGHRSTTVRSPSRPKEKTQNNIRKIEWASMPNTLKIIPSCPFRGW